MKIYKNIFFNEEGDKFCPAEFYGSRKIITTIEEAYEDFEDWHLLDYSHTCLIDNEGNAQKIDLPLEYEDYMQEKQAEEEREAEAEREHQRSYSVGMRNK